MQVTLIQATPEPVKTISDIAAICYDSEPQNPMGLVKHLYNNGHHSVFEHIYFTFKIEGISRACSAQQLRHRLMSPTEKSQRYCDMSKFDYVTPPEISRNEEALDIYAGIMGYIRSAYKELRYLGIEKEDARYVLPISCHTSINVSFNLRELIHIANERLCGAAQWEVRNLVKEMCILVDKDLQFMLVPKCQSGRLICNDKRCGK